MFQLGAAWGGQMVEEVTTRSWGSRIISAFMGVLVGLALIVGSFYLVFWNEGNGLHTAQSLQQAQQRLIVVPNAPIDPNNDKHVIYINGDMVVNDVLEDNLLGVSVKAVKLQRDVQMYQWEEDVQTRTEKKMGGSEQEIKTYTYKNTWSNHVIDSSHFKDPTGHQNPTSMPITSSEQYTKSVLLGDFHLPQDLIYQTSGEVPVDLSKADITPLESKLNKVVKRVSEGLYVGTNPESPVVGDIKITVQQILPQKVSIIAEQSGNSLQPFLAPAGKKVNLLSMGEVTPQIMINDALSANNTMTWILRLVSLVMMIIGFALILNPLVVIADFIPFLGSVLGFGTGLVSFMSGLVLWSIATAMAWFVVRPIWAVGLLIVVFGICYAIVTSKRGTGITTENKP